MQALAYCIIPPPPPLLRSHFCPCAGCGPSRSPVPFSDRPHGARPGRRLWLRPLLRHRRRHPGLLRPRWRGSGLWRPAASWCFPHGGALPALCLLVLGGFGAEWDVFGALGPVGGSCSSLGGRCSALALSFPSQGAPLGAPRARTDEPSESTYQHGFLSRVRWWVSRAAVRRLDPWPLTGEKLRLAQPHHVLEYEMGNPAMWATPC